MTSLFEARRRLPTSATSTTNGHLARALTILARTSAVTPFRVLTPHAALPCGSGETRRAAHRPLVKAPVPVPPGCPGFPDRDTDSSAPPPRVAPAELQWRSRCAGQRTERRTRRRPMRERLIRFSRPVHALRRAHADVVPFLGALWTSGVAGACAVTGGDPTRRTDRPRRAFRTCPAKGTRFPQTGMPSTADDFAGSSARMTPRRLPRVGPSLTPPTRSPQDGERCLHGHCKRHQCGHPRSDGLPRDERLCDPLDCSRLGLTTQARQRGSDDVAVFGGW